MNDIEQRLANRLKHAWANSVCLGETSPKPKQNTVMVDGKTSYYSDGRMAFYEAVQLLRDNFEGSISEDVISRLVGDRVTGLHQTASKQIEESASAAAHGLLEELTNCPRENVQINSPVFGASFWPPSLTVRAGKVTFYTPFSGIEEARCLKFVSVEDWKFINHGLPNGQNFGGSECWAKADVTSLVKDTDFQRSEATRLIREALALISIYVYSLDEDARRIISPGLTLMDVYTVSSDRYDRFVKEDLFNGKSRVTPFHGAFTEAYPLQLKNTDYTVYRDNGFEECANCIKTMGDNELQNRARRTLDYVAVALQTTNRSQRLVSLTTALEALLLHEEDRDGKSKKLQERVTGLLGSNYPDIEALYDLRSRIVHGDVTLGRTNTAIQRMEYVLYNLVKRLLNGAERFESLDQALGIHPL
jgi:hypothetical protein